MLLYVKCKHPHTSMNIVHDSITIVGIFPLGHLVHPPQ